MALKIAFKSATLHNAANDCHYELFNKYWRKLQADNKESDESCSLFQQNLKIKALGARAASVLSSSIITNFDFKGYPCWEY